MRIKDKPVKGAPLTKREVECLRIVAGGFTNTEVGAALGIHSDTVKFHLNSISTKFGTQNRISAVMLALRSGLIQLMGVEVQGHTCLKCGATSPVVESRLT